MSKKIFYLLTHLQHYLREDILNATKKEQTTLSNIQTEACRLTFM